MKEMGFILARRHAQSCRVIVFGLGFLFPIALVSYSMPFVLLAVIVCAVGYYLEFNRPDNPQPIPIILLNIAILIIPFKLLFIGSGLIATTLALFCCAIGVIVQRYLFFAQARHVVTTYYRPTATSGGSDLP